MNVDAPPRIPMRPGMMQNLEQRGQAILTQTEELTRRLNSLFDPANQKSLMTTIDNFGKASAAWKDKLNPTLARLPELVEQAKTTLKSINGLASDTSKLSNNLNQFANNLQAADGPLARFNQSMDRVSDSLIIDTLPRVQTLTSETRATMRSINRVSESLNERPQSLLFGPPAPAPGPGEPGFVAPK